MKKIFAITLISVIVLFALFAAGYCEEKSGSENQSLAKAIQSELPEVFGNGSAFAVSGGTNFLNNIASALPTVGVLSSSDLSLNTSIPVIPKKKKSTAPTTHVGPVTPKPYTKPLPPILLPSTSNHQ